MFTLPAPVLTDRYQVRFEGSVPMPLRLSDEMRSLVTEGRVQADDDAQALDRNGVPLWFVRLSLRDRESGQLMTERVRVASKDAPHADIPTGSYVRPEGLKVAHGEFNGRLNRRWTYTALSLVDPGQTAFGAKPLNRIALDASALTFEALSTLPKMGSHEDDVRAAIRAGLIDAETVEYQAVDRDGRPLWLVEVRIDDGLDIAYENVTVAGENPRLGGGDTVTVEGLTVAGWQVSGNGSQMAGTTLRADAIRSVRSRKQKDSTPAETPAEVAVS
ncbi:MAG: hypothetical protein R2715_15065 [Ilumatobacteraceae bacterium]